MIEYPLAQAIAANVAAGLNVANDDGGVGARAALAAIGHLVLVATDRDQTVAMLLAGVEPELAEAAEVVELPVGDPGA